MSFDTILWIVIILVYILGFVLRRVYAAYKKGKTEGAIGLPSWREKLEQFLAQARQEMEQKKLDKGENEWVRLSRPEEELEPAAPDIQALESPPAPDRDTVTREKREYVSEKKISLQLTAEAKGKERIVSGKRRRIDVLAWGRKDLKKVVIWSEILAPPLALRDRERQRPPA